LREIDYREFIIPAPPSQKENAQRIARSLTTSQLNRKEYSLFPVSVNVLTTWIGERLSNKEVQNFFASSKNRYETIKHTDLTYFIFPKDGVEFAFDKTNYLDTIFLKSNFYRSNSLPNGIQPNMARNEVIERLKQPVKSGGGGVFMGKTVPNFDIWVFEGYALHVQYNVKDSIDLITLMKPRAIKTA